MDTPSYWMRAWRIIHCGRSRPARPVDRIEAMVLLIAVFIAVAALPFAAAAGSMVFASENALSGTELATRHRVEAVVLEDGPPIAIAGRAGLVNETGATEATWMLADGTVKAGEVQAVRGTRAGAHVPVWLDVSGNAVEAPLTGAEAGIRGFGAGLGLWLAAVVLSALLYGVTRFFLDRVRAEHWQREWETVARRWSHS